MALNPEQFTDKVNEVLLAAHNLCINRKNPQILPIHIASILFQDNTSLGWQLCLKAKVEPEKVNSVLDRLLAKQSVQNPPPDQVGYSSSTVKFLRSAIELQKEQKDSHLAIDHLLLTLIKEDFFNEFAAIGLTGDKLKDLIKQIRKNKPITSKQAESNYEALLKYGTDLVKLAEEGKIDPVIGRDEEIRRVIQILSTTNQK